MEGENRRNTRLQKLSGSDFEIVDGQPDIMGWEVKNETGNKLGEVTELIFDYESRKVRYLVVDIGKNDYELEDKDVLVPIGIAELHESDDDVILPGVTPLQLRSLPEFDDDRFDTEHETNVRNVFGGLGATAANNDLDKTDDDFYNHHHFNETNLYRKRNRAQNEYDDESNLLNKDEPVTNRQQDNAESVRLSTRNEGEETDRINTDDNRPYRLTGTNELDDSNATGNYATRND